MIPPKFDPAPMHAMTQSGNSPSRAICETASWPMTVWWSNTEFSPLPTAKRDSLSSSASARASPVATGEGTDRLRVLLERPPPDFGQVARTLMDDRTEEPHHLAADGLLAQGGPDPEDRAAEAHDLARVGESGPPLARARARDQVLHACAGVVVGLRQGGVELVAPGEVGALVLVVDTSVGAEALLQAHCPAQGRRTVLRIQVKDLVGDRYEPIGRVNGLPCE